MKYGIWLVLILGTAVCSATGLPIEYGKDIRLTEDREIHQKIVAVITPFFAFTGKPQSEAEKELERQYYELLRPILQHAEKDRMGVIRQLVRYTITHYKDPVPERAIGIPVVIGSLFFRPLKLEDCERIMIMWPCYSLLNTKEKALFRKCVGNSPVRIVECIKGYTKETGKVPSGAVDWMFDASANAARNAIMELEETPEGEEQVMRQEVLPVARLWESRNSKHSSPQFGGTGRGQEGCPFLDEHRDMVAEDVCGTAFR